MLEQLLVAWQHELGLLLQRPGQFRLLQLGQHWWLPFLARCHPNRHTANTLHYQVQLVFLPLLLVCAPLIFLRRYRVHIASFL